MRKVCVSCAVLVFLTFGASVGSAGAGPKQPKPRQPQQRVPLAGKTYTWDFQADTLGLLPAHTMTFGGNWQVLEDSASVALLAALPDTVGADSIAGSAAGAAAAAPPGPPPRRLLAQLEDDDGLVYHYLTFTRPMLGDLDASVRFRIRSGEIDPSAGLMFQMDPKGTSGYLVRASGKSGELAFHYMLYGRRRDVKFAKIPELAPGTWHTLAVQRRRSTLRVFYDGKEAMMVRDDRFSNGTVGVWTEDDTRVDFADLKTTAR